MRRAFVPLALLSVIALVATPALAEPSKGKPAADTISAEKISAAVARLILYRPGKDTVKIIQPIYRPGIDKFELKYPVYRPGIDRIKVFDLSAVLARGPEACNTRNKQALSTSNIYERTSGFENLIQLRRQVLENERGSTRCVPEKQRPSF